MSTYKTSACEVCIIWRNPTETLKIHLPIAESMTGKPAMVTLKIKLHCFTVHDTTLWVNIFVRSHLGCGTDSIFIHFCRSHKYFKDAKVLQINRKISNLTSQAQSTTKTTGILTKVFCNSGSNLVILAWRGDELSHGQGQNGENFDFEVEFDLEGQGQSPSKTIGTLTKVFYTYGLNLVILARTGDELSRRQACGYHTHRRTQRQTDAGNDNTRRPKLASGKNHNKKVWWFFHPITWIVIYCLSLRKKQHFIFSYGHFLAVIVLLILISIWFSSIAYYLRSSMK